MPLHDAAGAGAAARQRLMSVAVCALELVCWCRCGGGGCDRVSVQGVAVRGLWQRAIWSGGADVTLPTNIFLPSVVYAGVTFWQKCSSCNIYLFAEKCTFHAGLEILRHSFGLHSLMHCYPGECLFGAETGLQAKTHADLFHASSKHTCCKKNVCLPSNS